MLMKRLTASVSSEAWKTRLSKGRSVEKSVKIGNYWGGKKQRTWTVSKIGYKSIYGCIFFCFFRTFVSISSGGLHYQKWCYWWVQLGNPVLMSAKNVVGLLFLFFSFFFPPAILPATRLSKSFATGENFTQRMDCSTN